MPISKRKKPQDWTTEEAIRRVFPKRVVDALHEVTADEPGDLTPEKPRRRPPTSTTRKGR